MKQEKEEVEEKEEKKNNNKRSKLLFLSMYSQAVLSIERKTKTNKR